MKQTHLNSAFEFKIEVRSVEGIELSGDTLALDSHGSRHPGYSVKRRWCAAYTWKVYFQNRYEEEVGRKGRYDTKLETHGRDACRTVQWTRAARLLGIESNFEATRPASCYRTTSPLTQQRHAL